MHLSPDGVRRVSGTLVDATQEDPLYLYEKNTPVRILFVHLMTWWVIANHGEYRTPSNYHSENAESVLNLT